MTDRRVAPGPGGQGEGGPRPRPTGCGGTRDGDSGGFTLIEVLIALMITTVALVAVAGMFPQGYKQVVDAGRLTLAVTTARQLLEDLSTVPFANLMALNGFDSQDPATIPATDPEMGIATRWQIDFPAGEGRAKVRVDDCGDVANPCGLLDPITGAPAPNGTLRQVTVTVWENPLQQEGPEGEGCERRKTCVQLTTLFARMF